MANLWNSKCHRVCKTDPWRVARRCTDPGNYLTKSASVTACPGRLCWQPIQLGLTGFVTSKRAVPTSNSIEVHLHGLCNFCEDLPQYLEVSVPTTTRSCSKLLKDLIVTACQCRLLVQTPQKGCTSWCSLPRKTPLAANSIQLLQYHKCRAVQPTFWPTPDTPWVSNCFAGKLQGAVLIPVSPAGESLDCQGLTNAGTASPDSRASSRHKMGERSFATSEETALAANFSADPDDFRCQDVRQAALPVSREELH